jgi:hypothetical protein
LCSDCVSFCGLAIRRSCGFVGVAMVFALVICVCFCGLAIRRSCGLVGVAMVFALVMTAVYKFAIYCSFGSALVWVGYPSFCCGHG